MAETSEKSRTIDRALAHAKRKFGWNQVRFAKELSRYGRNVVPQDVTNWKARGMPPEHHEAVAKMLGWSVDELLGLAKETMVKDVPRVEHLTLDETHLLHAYRAASPEKRMLFDALVKVGTTATPNIGVGPRARRLIEDRAALTKVRSVLDNIEQEPKLRRSKKRKRSA